MVKHDQAEGLRRKLDNQRIPKQAKTISVISGKGGVGKSNFALNFSLQLLSHQKKVLLFDLDVGMGNIDILMGMRSKRTIIDMFEEQLTIHDIIETGPNGLSYIAAGSGLNHFFKMEEADKSYFYDQYKALVEMYDYILFDMGAGVTEDGLFFILASDECIVITTPEPTSITDAYGMIKHVVSHDSMMPIQVVMNRSAGYQDGIRTLRQFDNVISTFLNIDIKAMGIIPDDKTVTQAVIRQVPYVLFNDKSSAARAIKEITFNYLSNSKELNRTASSSFVQKLKQLIAR
ncbi:MinD/ParA family protein [Oceanobacillus massiliensis]|uniref:MinD/ParA family protein n=1 Tax=Oceanobacillus massiliensis TaxID=1465765 RepID=UPI001F16018A|nr:MinD/ParA family protein [Oceanobacillus massiliensis]